MQLKSAISHEDFVANITELADMLRENIDVLQFFEQSSWTSIFEKYLITLPTSKQDDELLTDILELLCLVTKSKCISESQVQLMLSAFENNLIYLLDIPSKSSFLKNLDRYEYASLIF